MILDITGDTSATFCLQCGQWVEERERVTERRLDPEAK